MSVAIVTGAGRGIGAATAILLAHNGYRVMLVSRTEKELRETEAKIKKTKGDDFAGVCIGDVADESFVKSVFSKTLSELGEPTVLVNNAGMVEMEPIESTTIEMFDRTMAVNVRGCFLFAREFLKCAFRKLTDGVIVNIGSLAGIQGLEKFPGTAAYAMSKFAVIGLTEVLAVEGAAQNVKAYCVAPGAIDTKMLRDALPNLKTNTKPEAVAEVIVNLCLGHGEVPKSGSVIEMHTNA